MAKFNEVQKKRRAIIAERKRAVHGDPNSRKLKQKPQNVPLSGKRIRKLEKKWKRDQKEAIDKGLITMQDVEMAIADGDASLSKNDTKPRQFRVKKNSKVKLKQSMRKGKNKRKSPAAAAEASVDAMVD